MTFSSSVQAKPLSTTRTRTMPKPGTQTNLRGAEVALTSRVTSRCLRKRCWPCGPIQPAGSSKIPILCSPLQTESCERLCPSKCFSVRVCLPARRLPPLARKRLGKSRRKTSSKLRRTRKSVRMLLTRVFRCLHRRYLSMALLESFSLTLTLRISGRTPFRVPPTSCTGKTSTLPTIISAKPIFG